MYWLSWLADVAMFAIVAMVVLVVLRFVPVEGLGGIRPVGTTKKSCGVALLSNLNHGPDARNSCPSGLRIRRALP